MRNGLFVLSILLIVNQHGGGKELNHQQRNPLKNDKFHDWINEAVSRSNLVEQGKKRDEEKNANENAKLTDNIVNSDGLQAMNDEELSKEYKSEEEADLEKKDEFIEGDIRKTKLVETIMQGKQTGQKREVMDAVKWPSTVDQDGSTIVVVPFEISDNLEDKAQSALSQAIKDYDKFTCIRFIKRKDEEKDYIKFVKSTGCWSYLGRTRGKQRLSIGKGCEFKGTVIHEMMHLLGFLHEHTRPDRDNFVKIIMQNIKAGYEKNFMTYNHQIVSTYNAPYDYFSVMHYNQYSFSSKRGKLKTIEPKKIEANIIGQRVGFSRIDIDQINKAYCRKEITTTKSTTTTTTPITTTSTTIPTTTTPTTSTTKPTTTTSTTATTTTTTPTKTATTTTKASTTKPTTTPTTTPTSTKKRKPTPTTTATTKPTTTTSATPTTTTPTTTTTKASTTTLTTTSTTTPTTTSTTTPTSTKKRKPTPTTTATTKPTTTTSATPTTTTTTSTKVSTTTPTTTSTTTPTSTKKRKTTLTKTTTSKNATTIQPTTTTKGQEGEIVPPPGDKEGGESDEVDNNPSPEAIFMFRMLTTRPTNNDSMIITTTPHPPTAHLYPCWPFDFKWVQDLHFPTSCGCHGYKPQKCSGCICVDITNEEASLSSSHLCFRKRTKMPQIQIKSNDTKPSNEEKCINIKKSKKLLLCHRKSSPYQFNTRNDKPAAESSTQTCLEVKDLDKKYLCSTDLQPECPK